VWKKPRIFFLQVSTSDASTNGLFGWWWWWRRWWHGGWRELVINSPRNPVDGLSSLTRRWRFISQSPDLRPWHSSSLLLSPLQQHITVATSARARTWTRVMPLCLIVVVLWMWRTGCTVIVVVLVSRWRSKSETFSIKISTCGIESIGDWPSVLGSIGFFAIAQRNTIWAYSLIPVHNRKVIRYQ